MPSVQSWELRGRAELLSAGVPSPRTDARELLKGVLGWTDTELFLRAAHELNEAQAARFVALIQARASRIPLQHLLGEVEWGGVRLRVDGRALIPRPETEWLLHLAVQELRGWSAPRVLDVGTGTGALALGLKAALPAAQVTASDLSPDALALARENAELNGLDVSWVQTGLLEGLSGPYDLIVSNPPYLPEADALDAEPEVKHDPALALYAGADGLALARPLVAQARTRLAAGGVLLLELDPRNVAVLAAELRAMGAEASVLPDLTGRERFVRVMWPARVA